MIDILNENNTYNPPVEDNSGTEETPPEDPIVLDENDAGDDTEVPADEPLPEEETPTDENTGDIGGETGEESPVPEETEAPAL